MKQLNLTEFNKYLNDQVGQPYVWGGQHLKLTPDNYVSVITKRESNETHRNNAIAFCKKKFDAGATVLYAYDCSGLGMYELQNVKGIYSHDMTAAGMLGQCEKVGTAKNGYWVFRTDEKGSVVHIGYMISDSYLVEAKGRAYGVVRTKYKPSAWNIIGKPKCIAFDIEPKPTVYEIKVKGSVNVRKGNSVLSKRIATVRNCNLPYLGQAIDYPNWYMTRINGQDGYITSNPKYTEVVEVEL